MRFAHEVELVPGVYFTETLISKEELAARLLGQVASTLPSGEQVQQNYLTVQQVFRETYEETVPYPTQEVENGDLAWGKRVRLCRRMRQAQSLSRQTWYIRTARNRAAPSSAKRRWWRPCRRLFRLARWAAPRALAS